MSSSSALNRKFHFQARSNSLPLRSHPIVSQIDEKLCRLKPTESASSSICNNLNGLTDLYDLVNNLLLLPLTQPLAQECNEKQIDEVLDRSLRLMDVCVIIKDALMQIKEGTKELQSILRRRRSDESRLANEIGKYSSSRKKVNKAIHKSLRDIMSRSKFSSSDNEDAAIINILREVEGVAITVFESLLSYTSVAKPKGWSLVSKLMQSKRVSCETNAAETNEFEKVDAELNNLIHHQTRKSSSSNAENALNVLGNLELSIQDIEERLECLQRFLIKTRVSLLNIINH